jgi:hypothetical protein
MRTSHPQTLNKQAFNQVGHNEFSGTNGSDSKQFRRISDKSEDNQRFFKNLVDLPSNSNVLAGVKTTTWGMNNVDNSKSDAGGRGTNGKTLPLGYKGGAQMGLGVANLPAVNMYSAEGSQAAGQTGTNGIQSQGNSYNSRAALNSQLAPNAQGNSQSEQSLKNLLPMNKNQAS